MKGLTLLPLLGPDMVLGPGEEGSHLVKATPHPF